MKINVNYRDTIISVPAENITRDIASLSEGEMRVLLYLCATPDFRADTDACKARAIKELDMQWISIEQAVALLCERGVITTPSTTQGADGAPDAEKRDKRPRASVKADSPSYTKEETAQIIGRSAELKKLINDDIPRLLGKTVTHGEAMMIVSMYDYLRMKPDYIVKLVSYCVSIDKKSLRYAEGMAFTLFDANVTDMDGLNAYLEAETRRDSVTQKVRALFGIGQRALIAKEKRFISLWTDTYGYGVEIIEKAYELTIQRINEPSMSYASAILKSWYENHLTTLEEIEAEIGKPYAGSSGKSGSAQSFNTDEFLQAALNRSYSDKKDN